MRRRRRDAGIDVKIGLYWLVVAVYAASLAVTAWVLLTRAAP